MNIWYLTTEYPPDFGGGISMYIDQVANLFVENGHKVTVLVRDENRNAIEYPRENLRVVRFKHMVGEQYSVLGYWTALSYQYYLEVKNLLEGSEEIPDIIEVQDYNAIGYYLLQQKYILGDALDKIKIVVHLHTPTFELSRINQVPRYKFPEYWIGQMEKFCINAADDLVTQSEYLKDKLQPFAPGKKINVIPLPFSFEKDVQVKKETDILYDLLFLGRCEYRKGIFQLLKQIDKAWNQGEKYKICVLGGDTFFYPKNVMLGKWLKNKYKHRIEEGLLTFKESVPPNKMKEELQKARTVIIPSLYENFPYNCIIAMGNKIPVIVSKSGGQAEMVNESGKNGLIFDWEIEDDCLKKVKELLNYSVNELNLISQNGFDRINLLCDLKNNYRQRSVFYSNVLKKEKNLQYPISLSIPKRRPLAKEFSCEKGLLSVVVPYYNLPDYVEETVMSIIASDYQHFEILIVNDGSNDEKSLKVLKKLEDMDERIKVIFIENAGLANARNVGACNAKGEYIAFLDADDLINLDFYSKAINLLRKYDNISFVYSWVEFFENRSGTWPTFSIEFPYLLGMNMLAAFVVVRKNDFLNFGMNKPEMEYGLEDYESWVSMGESGCAGVSLPEALVKYRVRIESMSRQFNRPMLMYLLDCLSKNHTDTYSKFSTELYSLLVANGPGYLWNNPTFETPMVTYTYSPEGNVGAENYETRKVQLIKMANSSLGSFIIKCMFKLRLHKLFR